MSDNYILMHGNKEVAYVTIKYNYRKSMTKMNCLCAVKDKLTESTGVLKLG